MRVRRWCWLRGASSCSVRRRAKLQQPAATGGGARSTRRVECAASRVRLLPAARRRPLLPCATQAGRARHTRTASRRAQASFAPLMPLLHLRNPESSGTELRRGARQLSSLVPVREPRRCALQPMTASRLGCVAACCAVGAAAAALGRPIRCSSSYRRGCLAAHPRHSMLPSRSLRQRSLQLAQPATEPARRMSPAESQRRRPGRRRRWVHSRGSRQPQRQGKRSRAAAGARSRPNKPCAARFARAGA
jgi:hypothetical protein